MCLTQCQARTVLSSSLSVDTYWQKHHVHSLIRSGFQLSTFRWQHYILQDVLKGIRSKSLRFLYVRVISLIIHIGMVCPMFLIIPYTLIYVLISSLLYHVEVLKLKLISLRKSPPSFECIKCQVCLKLSMHSVL